MSIYLNLARRFTVARLPAALRGTPLPLKLTVASTFQCNHQCQICSVWRVYRDEPAKAAQELTADEFGRIFHELRDSLLFLDWGGGEPFLRKDLREILGCAARTCPKLASFVITSNGLLTSRIVPTVSDLAGAHPRHQFSLGISLDGEEEVHDRIRGRTGAFKAACDTLRELKRLSRERRNVEVKISYTLCHLNPGRFADFHQRVLRPLGLNAGDVGFNLEHVGNLFQTQGFSSRTVGEISSEEFTAGIRKDIEYALGQIRQERLPALQRLKSFYRTFFLENIPGYLEHPDRMVIPCAAARNSLYLDPYGNFYPCVVWTRRLGSCREGGIGAFWKSEAAEQVRQTIDRKQCPVCWNACEAIPSLLTSWRMAGCVMRSLVSG